MDLLWSAIALGRPAAITRAGFLLDIIDHRGQLSTYLRPMGSTMPQKEALVEGDTAKPKLL